MAVVVERSVMTLQSAVCVLRNAPLKKGEKSTSDTLNPKFRTGSVLNITQQCYVSTTALEG